MVENEPLARIPREIGLARLRGQVCTNDMFYKISLFAFSVAKQPNLAGSSLYALFIQVSRDPRLV